MEKNHLMAVQYCACRIECRRLYEASKEKGKIGKISKMVKYQNSR